MLMEGGQRRGWWDVRWQWVAEKRCSDWKCASTDGREPEWWKKRGVVWVLSLLLWQSDGWVCVVVVVVTEWWVSVSVSSAANVATRRWVEWQCRTTTTELFSISSHDTKLSPLAASVSVNSCVHIFVSCLISLLTDKCWHECLKAFAQYRAGKIPTEPVFEHFSTDVIAHLYYYLKVIVWKFGYLYI